MVIPDLANPAWSMGPAIMVGGRRRRSTRRSNALRSNTTPNLSLDSLAGMENASGVTAGLGTCPVENSHVSSSFEPSESMVNHYAFNSGPPVDCHRSPISRPFDGSLRMPVAHSPTPTTGSASTTATESRRKHGKFGFMSKDQDRPERSHEPAHQLSPLPPLTPVKAAQLLGVDAGPGRIRSNSEGRRSQHDDGYAGPPVWPTSTWQAPTPALVTSKGVSSKQTKSKEEGIDPDLPKVKSFWGNRNKKAQRMLGLLPSAVSNSKREADMEPVAAVSLARRTEDDTDAYYCSESELDAHSRLLHSAARPSSEVPRRRMRKKVPKLLDRMAPIMETSHDELRSSYHNSEHNPELGVISEYEQYNPFIKPPLPQLHTESLLTLDPRYELEEDDLSPTDQVVEAEAEEGEEEFAIHPGNALDVQNIVDQPPAVFRLRSPLQTVEGRLLDEAEAQLAIGMAQQNRNDAARLILDTDYADLKASNETMRMEFAAAKHGVTCEARELFDGADSEDDEDLISICSSIDLDEEPTVRVAKVIPFTRITPGMVKLVDIPPRKKKPVAPAVPIPLLALSSQLKAPFKAAGAYYFQHDDRISPFNERSEHAELTVMPGHLTARNYNRTNKDKKPKMPRDDSHLLVQDWMSTYDHAKQRPLSERMDLDVLADQQIPPAPFPKEDHSTLPYPHSRPAPHPTRLSSTEHYCLKNGHIFHPINLKTVPDEVAINSLAVRPYMHTAVGYKQHVSVPVFCDRCDRDVKEELWECDIAVCRMGVCRRCAEDMEHEWQERVANAWTH
ncbi:uncharacterized protein ALTATR162_LOCUS2484 [Alternaria atra]|uniref:Uncharacterized protein n=1 Tax=Alternaria atra TaxID=119953 RepID=A0A8J2HZ67_9PLEO|nr:uncharacterized protein ALTATR162_LOCUS2484 [Alternaria atra]CAG5149902.1 unnamed protein product [Alternaria atra]